MSKWQDQERIFSIRFWRRVDKTDGCWLWTGSTFQVTGYGQISGFDASGKKRNFNTHRISYEIHKGPIPSKAFVCHSCDNRKCVNPRHLFLGNAKINVKDMFEKGRQHNRKGSKNSQSKLTESDIVRIRELLKKGLSQKEIGKIFDVTQSLVSGIYRGKRWKHI